MYNLKVNEEIQYVSKDNIYKYISSKDIFQKYLGISDINYFFRSPLRNDSNPTCNLFIGRKGQMLYIDFGKSNSVCDGIGFVSQMYNISFTDTLNKISHGFNLPLGLSGIVNTDIKPVITLDSCIKKEDLPKSDILIKTRKFEEYDLYYWNSYGITLNTLKQFNVYAVNTVYRYNKIVWRNREDNPIYCYRFNDNKKKCYRPLEKNKKYKFVTSSEISSILQGYTNLPDTGDLLIITKALKDVMCLYELGYTSVAPNAESYNIDDLIIEELKNRFKKIIVFYDNDEAGITNGNYLADLYSMEIIFLPAEEAKDISDYYKKYGKEKTVSILKILTQ
jgi:hypothetical protein